MKTKLQALKTWLKEKLTWKNVAKFAAANAVSMILQLAIIGLLCLVGLSFGWSLVIGKAVSYVVFAVQMWCMAK